MNCDKHYFLGTNAETGFVSLYDDFIKGIDNVYIIKGGPGTGKSTLMKKTAGSAMDKGYNIEYIHCSSDPDSLDGIYIKEIETCIMDGTSPHLLEPPYPGAVGKLINLYEYWDNEFLKKHYEEIKRISSNISETYERVYLYIAAVGKLQRDLNKIGFAITNKVKLKGYFERLCSKHIKQTEEKAKERKVFLSSITPKGYKTFLETINTADYKTLVIDDEYGVSAKALEIIKQKAMKYGHSIISCYSPIIPNMMEHLVIPTAKLNVCTSNSLHKIEAQPYCRINITRFFYSDIIKNHKEKISFLIRAREEIINESVKLLINCHNKHNDLEEIYKTAVNFDALTQYTDNLIEQIID